MFFPVKDCAEEQAMIPNRELRVINSPWAHFAMLCMTEQDQRAIDGNLRDLPASQGPTAGVAGMRLCGGDTVPATGPGSGPPA